MSLRHAFVVVTLGAALATAAAADEAKILSGSVAVQAASYQAYTITVDAERMRNAAITGHVQASGGTGNDIIVAVLSESDYLNWKNGHANHPLYNSGQVTAADVYAPVAASGTYYLLISNVFSAFTPKTVDGTLSLTWTPPPPLAAFPAGATTPGTDVPSFLAILVLLAVAGFGGLVAWFILARRQKAATTETKAA
jgi:hypothetical protein